MNDLIFLDTETTGLDPDKHEIWEMAWAVNDGPVSVVQFSHSIRTADANAFEHNRYRERYQRNQVISGLDELALRESLRGQTLVCANPTFDRMFMLKRWGVEPYHYRSVDIESMAMIVFDWDRPRGLKAIAEELRTRGYPITNPLHEAWADVTCLRECYHALREENKKYKIY